MVYNHINNQNININILNIILASYLIYQLIINFLKQQINHQPVCPCSPHDPVLPVNPGFVWQ